MYKGILCLIIYSLAFGKPGHQIEIFDNNQLNNEYKNICSK